MEGLAILCVIIIGMFLFVFIATICLLAASARHGKQIKALEFDLRRIKDKLFPVTEKKPAETKEVKPVSPPEKVPERLPKPYQVLREEKIPELSAPPEPVKPEVAKPPRARINWETVIGEQLFLKLGIIVFVIGIALLLGYSWDKLGAAGKVGIGIGSGLVALVGGVILSKKYKTFGTGLICAGWAILYFTAYAMHHLEAARVIESPLLGGIVLGLVAAGMIVHTLLYHSQAFTTLAFALGYVAILLSELGVHSLAASLVLAVVIVAIAHRAKWYYFPLVGLGLTYLVHLVWLWKPIQIFETDKLSNPSFYIAMVNLILAWLIYKMPNFLAKPVEQVEVRLHHLLTVANLGVFMGLALLQMHKWSPSLKWLFFLEGALAYICFAIILRSLQRFDLAHRPEFAEGKKHLYLFDGSVAVVLMALAIGLKLSGKWITLGWLVEVQAVVMAGILLREPVFRHLGSLLLVVPFWRLVRFDIPEAGGILFGEHTFSDALPLVALFTALGYADAVILYKAFLPKLSAFYERHIYRSYGYLGSLLLVITLYLGLTRLAIAIGLGLATIVLVELGLTTGSFHLRLQGYLVSIVTVVQLFLSNFSAEEGIWGISYRIITVSLVTLFFLYLFQRLVFYPPQEKKISPDEHKFGKVYLYTAVALVFLLLWFEIPRPWLAIGWLNLALVLLIVGLSFRDIWDLRLLSLFVAIAAAGNCFVNGLSEYNRTGGVSYHLIITFILAIGLLFIPFTGLGILLKRASASAAGRKRWFDSRFVYVVSLMATVLLATFLALKVGRRWVTFSWGLEGIGLLVIGFLLKESSLRLWALGLLIFSLAKLVTYDMSGIGMIYRIFAYISLGLILLIISYLYTRYRAKISKTDKT